jgi:hypothetical protein
MVFIEGGLVSVLTCQAIKMDCGGIIAPRTLNLRARWRWLMTFIFWARRHRTRNVQLLELQRVATW